MADDVLTKRCRRFLEVADTLWKKEDMETRLKTLSSYYHRGHGADEPDPDIIHIQEVYPRVTTRVASMHARRPEVLVKPRRVGFDQAAIVSELLLNYLTRFLKWSNELREVLFYACLYPYGVMKLGMEREPRTGFDLPMMRAWKPEHFRCDPTMDRFRPAEGQWQAFRYRRSLAVLEASGLYDEKGLDQLRERVGHDEPDWTPETTEVWVTEHFLFPAPGRRDVQIMVFADGYNDRPFDSGDTCLIRNEPWTKVVGLPGRVLAFLPSPMTWHPISPVEMWLPALIERNLFRTLKVRAAQRAIPKTLADANALGDEGLSALETSAVKQIVPVKNPPAGGLDKVTAKMESSEVSIDVLRGEDDAEMTIQDVDGASGVQLGRSEPQRGSTSATRDSLIESNFRLRSAQQQEIWEDFLEDTYQGALNLAQAHMSGDLWLKTTGTQERRLSREEIQLDADVVLAFGSTQPKDRITEREDARELFALLVNNPGINQVWLNRYVLQKQGDVKDIEGALQGLPPMPPQMGGLPGAPGPMGMPAPAGPPPPLDAGSMAAMATQGTQEGRTPLSMASLFREMSG